MDTNHENALKKGLFFTFPVQIPSGNICPPILDKGGGMAYVIIPLMLRIVLKISWLTFTKIQPISINFALKMTDFQ